MNLYSQRPLEAGYALVLLNFSTRLAPAASCGAAAMDEHAQTGNVQVFWVLLAPEAPQHACEAALGNCRRALSAGTVVPV